MVGSRIGFPQESAPRAAAVLQPFPQLGLQKQVPVYDQHQRRADQQQSSIPERNDCRHSYLGLILGLKL